MVSKLVTGDFAASKIDLIKFARQVSLAANGNFGWKEAKDFTEFYLIKELDPTFNQAIESVKNKVNFGYLSKRQIAEMLNITREDI